MTSDQWHFFAKVLEWIVYLQVVTYIEDRELLDLRQSGFRQGYSTQSALLWVMEEVRKGIDQRKLTILVLFDFSKAFDLVPHSLLLSKLWNLGLSQPVIRWFADYLADRCQAVVGENGELSSWVYLERGVPQGSVLDPLLFSLFINDLGKALSNSVHMIYADDLQIYHQCSPAELSGALAKVQADVMAVQAWANYNDLSRNTAKTKVLILGSNPFVTRLDLASLPKLRLGTEQLSYVCSVRNLGLILDNKLLWNEQVSAISNRVHAILRQLSASRNLLCLSFRKSLIMTLIFPIFDYCCVVYLDIGSILDLKLIRLLNSCVRFVFGARKDEHVSPLRRELGWLTIRDRRLYFLGITIYMLLSTNRPLYLRELLSRRVKNPTKRIVEEDLIIPRFNTEKYRNSFSVSGAYFWNSLPQELREVQMIASFKVQLYNYLFQTEHLRV